MKKILVINSGSSSLKYQLFETDGNVYRVLIKGIAERIGINGSNISYQTNDGVKEQLDIPLSNHEMTLKAIFDILLQKSLHSIDELWAVGHRLGHGGEYFDKSVIIDNDVMDKIYETKDLLPLHGMAFIYGIEAMRNLLPHIKQVATFDSAFHQTMPKEAYLYALPLEQYEKYRIRRYGFHGTSHYYVSRELLKIMPSAKKIISCHLGSGSSITAIKDGKSIDTTFGFAASCGVTMGTRCGDIDAFIPLYIMKTQNKTADEVNQMMNKESGLLALSGGYSDTRDIEKKYYENDEKAITAVNIYVHNVVKYIDQFNSRIKPLLVCFSPEIRDKIIIKNPEERQYFTEEQCKLVSGYPNKETDQDTFEQLMTPERKEIEFWTKINEVPPFVKECGINWEELVEKHNKIKEEEQSIIFQEENAKYLDIISNLTEDDVNDFEEKGEIPSSLLNIVTLDSSMCFKFIKLPHMAPSTGGYIFDDIRTYDKSEEVYESFMESYHD